MLGSLPLLNKKIELINKNINRIPKSSKIVKIKIEIIKKGFTISIPVTLPIVYPKIINAAKLNKIVINNPKKSSINLSDFWTLGDIVPIYKCEVKRDINTVEISPIREFNDGNTKRIIGKLYNTSSLPDKSVPENSPIIDDNITIIIDSLNIFLKYSN